MITTMITARVAPAAATIMITIITITNGHHHADEVFTSWGVETPKRFSREELEKILETLSKSGLYGLILRAKGIIQNTDGSWMEFDFVPEEYEIREGNPDYTGRLCVIGSLLDEDGLKELFGV